MVAAKLDYFEQLLKRLRRECEAVKEDRGSVGGEASSSSRAEAVGALRVQVSAALDQLRQSGGPTWAAYEAERVRLTAALDECEAEVRRLEELVSGERALDEAEALVEAKRLEEAGRRLASVAANVLPKRRRALCGTLEARAWEAAAAVEATNEVIRFPKHSEAAPGLASAVACLGFIGGQERFLEAIAAALEPQLLQATGLERAPTNDAWTLLLGADANSAEALKVWLAVLREDVGFEDEAIIALHDHMKRWPLERLAADLAVGATTLEEVDVGPLSIRVREVADAADRAAAAEALATARDLVLGDWHNDSEVHLDDLCSTDGDRAEARALRVSLLAQNFVAHAETLLTKALEAGPSAAARLVADVRRAFELYRALFPLAHADTARAHQRMATLFRNDLLFLTHAANKFSVRYCPKLNAKQPHLPNQEAAYFTFVDQLQPLRDLARDLVPTPAS